MLAVEVEFPAGRYHATPWDRHVNEGVVDWPPSPWRLVRALQAVWLARAWEEIPEPTVTRLLGDLCSDLPCFALPVASTGHTRHFMPGYPTTMTGKESDKVFDTFAAVDRSDRLRVVWPAVSLDPEALSALDLLLERLTWLGRAESWVTARRVAVEEPPTECRPAGGEAAGAGEERIRLLCPRSPEDYQEWQRSLPRPKGKGKKPLAPERLFEALMLETAELKSAGWSQPPAGRWVDYLRPADCLDGAATNRRPLRSRRRSKRPQVARFALSSPAPPDLTQAVRVGEKLHQALVKRSQSHPTFTGREPDGTRRTGHRHAHFLAEPGPRGSTVRYATVWAPEGFDDDALRALESLTWLSHLGDHPLQVVLLGHGTSEDVRPTPGRSGTSASPLFGTSRVWASLTPFVPTRHPRSRGSRKFEEGLLAGSPEHDLRRLLRAGGHPDPAEISALAECEIAGRAFAWNRFRTRRLEGDGAFGSGPAVGWRLVFPEPVSGPLCLGYGSHFGLGLFVPVQEGPGD